MIAIDWSHTKDLTTYDGKKVRVEDKKALLKRLKSILHAESKGSVILEQGCPLSLTYSLLLAGTDVYTISNRATQDYRVEHGIEKSDENDAKIIYELAQNGAKLEQVTLDNKEVQLKDLYHQYCRYQKARVSLQNMKKAHVRHYGDGESNTLLTSIIYLKPSPSFLAYDIAIDTLKAQEHSCLDKLLLVAKGLPLFDMVGGESMMPVKSTSQLQPPAIKGLGKRIWIGLIVTADPIDFKCLSAYLRFCGLTNDVMLTHKYSRHAKMLYHMLAEEVMKQRDPLFRPVYDKCKVDITEKHPDYTKMHIHNAALNRTATFLAKHIFNHRRGGDESTSP